MILGSLLLAVIGALATGAYLQVSRVVERNATEHAQSVVGQLVDMLERQVRQYAATGMRVGAQPEIQAFYSLGDSGTRGRAVGFLHSALARDSGMAALELLDPTGHRLLGDGPDVDRVPRLPHEELLERAMVADSGVVGRFMAIDSTVVVPSMAAVVLDSQVKGYVVVWRRISRNLKAREQFGKLIGNGGVLYIGSTDGAWTDQVSLTTPPPIDVSHLSGIASYKRPGTGPRLASAAAVQGAPWIVLLEFSRDTVLAPARQFVGGFAALAVLVLVLGLLAAWISSRQITVPLMQMTTAADAIRLGDHSARVPVNRTDELGRLAMAFNAMVDRVDQEVAARVGSEEEWRLLFEHNPHPMWVYDRDTLRILRVNESAVEQYGYTREEFEQLSLADLRPPEDVPRLQALLRTMGDEDRQVQAARHRRKDGTIISVETRGRPLDVPGHRARLVSATDVTDRSVLESQLRQSQKMEAIGRLAGGVAHDFNNLLTVIGASAELLGDAPLDVTYREQLKDLTAATDRAASLTRQLLMFSRKQIVQHRDLDLNEVVTHLQPMLARLLFEHIQFRTLLSPTPVRIVADGSQLEQVIVNLAVNASDAMPTGGSLTIETGTVELDAAYAQGHAGVLPGTYAMLAVSDTGIGMDSSTIEKIFEPFFTTKPLGEGTGLGLATVYGIIKELGGHIWVYSEVGRGATFKIYLPVRTADTAPASDPNGRQPPGAPPRGTETILLVEDNAMVRLAIRRMLERIGYHVLEASQGRQALDTVATSPIPIHLILTDLMMPEMDGRTLALELQSAWPTIRVVFTSGYTDDAVLRRGLVESTQTFLQKPFTADQLARTIRSALDATPPPVP